MGPIQAIKSGFSKAFEFSGRSSRSEFWWFNLFTFVFGILFVVIDTKIFGHPYGRFNIVSLSSVFFLITVSPLLALGFRRFQDVGLSGNLSLILMLIGYGIFFYNSFSQPSASVSTGFDLVEIAHLIATYCPLIICLFPSQNKPNQYGPNPTEVPS